MASRFSVGTPADDAEVAAYSEAVKQVYNATNDANRAEWIRRNTSANLRVVRDGSAIVGGLVSIPMGQFYGGRSVPMVGVAAVAVLPEHRGSGAGGALMNAYVAEMRAAGLPISTLYPATQPLYRNAGYERAGGEYRIEVEANRLDGGDRELAVRAAKPEDEPVLEECYRRRARLSSGNLDRNAYIWSRIRSPISDRVVTYVVEGPSGVEGYVRYVTKENDVDPAFKLWCPDVVALTPGAARRIVGFFADHWSLTGQIAWRGSPADPLLAVRREPVPALVKLWNIWMLRILDVATSMTARGWSPGVAGEVHLDITADEVLPENAGRWIVRVGDGRAEAERGGRGTLRTDIRGLAAMYTGFHAPADLRAAGFVDADDATLASATALFAGPHPWMADHF